MKKTTGVFFIIIILTGNLSYSQLWKSFSDSAAGFAKKKEPDRAINYYIKAKDLLERDSIYSINYSQTCINLADLYNLTGQQKKTMPMYLAAKETIEKMHGKTNIAYAVIVDRLGQLLLPVNPIEAEKYFIEGKDIRESLYGKGSPAYATGCNSLGIFYQRTGDLKKAEALFLEAKRIRDEQIPRDEAEIARSYNNLAVFYWNMGENEKAEPLALEARRIREIKSGKQSREYANTCMNLGNICRDMGQNEKAKQFYLEGKAIRESLFTKNSDDYLESAISLANLYAMMDEHKLAESFYIEVREIRGQANKRSAAYALVCNNLGDLYTNKGRYIEAESLLLEAKNIWDSVLDKRNPYHAYNRNSLGQLYFSKGDYKKSESFFLEARQMWESILGKAHAYYIQNTTSLARLYWDMNRTQKADELYSQASDAQYNLISKAFQFTNETEKGLYLKNIIGTTDEYYSFYYKKFPRDAAAKPFSISLQNRNLILSSAQQMRQVLYNNKDTSVNNALTKWISLKEQLAHLYSQNNSKAEQIKQTEELADTKEKELSRLSSVFAKSQKKTNWQDLQRQLKKNEAAIEFIRFHIYDGKQWADSIIYAALILKPGTSQPVFVPLFENRKLNELVDQKLSEGEAAVNQLYNSSALFELVWRPVEKHLAGISTIYFAPTGDLFRLSFGALFINPKTVLSDKYHLVQLNTTADIRKRAEDFIKSPDNIQLYGGIEYDADANALKAMIGAEHKNTTSSRSLPDDLVRGSSFQYLPGTMNETDAISKQAKKAGIAVSVVSGMRATEESFDSLGGASSPSVLHIATHGFFFDDPANSRTDSSDLQYVTSGKVFRQSDNPLFRAGLLFAGANNAWRGRYSDGIEDGIVTAYEVSNLFFPNTKMVVLSACQTALGDIKGSEGVYGLQRAFKIAGVQNLVMSLWKVPDRETSEFMKEFYKNLFSKQSVGTAFYNAQLKMKSKYRHEPFKWAAWVLIR